MLYSLVTRDGFLFFANAPGLMVGLFCTITILPLADPLTRTRVETLLFVLLGVDLLFSGFGAFIVTTDEDIQQLILGLMGNLVLLIYYAAPLSTMWQIVKTRDASSIYAPMAMANIANGFCWTVYGIVRNDWFLTIPNGTGCALGVVQLIMRMIYNTESEKLPAVQPQSSATKATALDAASVHKSDVASETSSEGKVTLNPTYARPGEANA